MTKTIKTDHYFGGCPECGGMDGMANAGKAHWFYCKQHKTMWTPGTNLFSSAKAETVEYQRNRWYEIGMDEFTIVHPILPEEFCKNFSSVDNLEKTETTNTYLSEINNYLFGDDDPFVPL